jgi:hypothetical protein
MPAYLLAVGTGGLGFAWSDGLGASIIALMALLLSRRFAWVQGPATCDEWAPA